jgi:hypothetical protein
LRNKKTVIDKNDENEDENQNAKVEIKKEDCSIVTEKKTAIQKIH